MIHERNSLRHRTVGLWGGVAGVAGGIAYPILLNWQAGIQNAPRTVFIAAYITLMAGLSLVSALASGPRSRLSQMLLLTAGTGNLALGVLTVFSIGLPLVLAGALQLAVATTGGVRPLLKVLLPALALLLLLVGLVTS